VHLVSKEGFYGNSGRISLGGGSLDWNSEVIVPSLRVKVIGGQLLPSSSPDFPKMDPIFILDIYLFKNSPKMAKQGLRGYTPQLCPPGI